MNVTQNGLFSQLSKAEQTLLQSACEPVTLKARQVLGLRDAQPHVYFLAGATVAMMVEEPQHKGLAVGLLGADDAAGLEHVLGDTLQPTIHPLKLRVQTAGLAWRVSAQTVQNLALKHPTLLLVISRQLWHMVTHVATVAADIQTLDIQARLAAWLVLSAQKAQTHNLCLTHEHLAQMLGVRRVSITLAAGVLRDQALLEYDRGQLRILNMPGLIQATQSA